MGHVEQATEFFQAIESQDWSKVTSITSEDFCFVGPTPSPFNKEVWLDFQKAVQKAFPDWAFNLTEVEEQGDEVRVTVQITGTHKEDLVLPIHSIKALPATGLAVALPEEHAFLSFKDGKISKLVIEGAAHGGLVGILEQLEKE